MSTLIRSVNRQSQAERIRAELGESSHRVIPSVRGWDVVELTETEQIEAHRSHYLRRAEILERSAGAVAIMARVSKNPKLEAEAKAKIAKALELRAQAERVGVVDDTEPHLSSERDLRPTGSR